MNRHFYDERKRKKCFKEKLDDLCNFDSLPQFFENGENFYKFKWAQESTIETSTNCQHSCKKSLLDYKPKLRDLYDPLTANATQLKQYRKFLLEVIL